MLSLRFSVGENIDYNLPFTHLDWGCCINYFTIIRPETAKDIVNRLTLAHQVRGSGSFGLTPLSDVGPLRPAVTLQALVNLDISQNTNKHTYNHNTIMSAIKGIGESKQYDGRQAHQDKKHDRGG